MNVKTYFWEKIKKNFQISSIWEVSLQERWKGTKCYNWKGNKLILSDHMKLIARAARNGTSHEKNSNSIPATPNSAITITREIWLNWIDHRYLEMIKEMKQTTHWTICRHREVPQQKNWNTRRPSDYIITRLRRKSTVSNFCIIVIFFNPQLSYLFQWFNPPSSWLSNIIIFSE